MSQDVPASQLTLSINDVGAKCDGDWAIHLMDEVEGPYVDTISVDVNATSAAFTNDLGYLDDGVLRCHACGMGRLLGTSLECRGLMIAVWIAAHSPLRVAK